MLKRAATLLTIALLSGCASVSYMQKTYSSMKKEHFVHASLPNGFDIYDNATESKMLIIIDKAAAIQKGAISGATLYIADVKTPLETIKHAAGLYLASNGRNCTVTGATAVLQPTNYEATYTCT